jgi:diguanylate cyclase (GGDEF)-like protein
VFPILDEQRVLGLLEIEAERGLEAREETLVTGILRIVRNHLALLDYGERDTLTGLINRKTFDASFGKLRARAERGSDEEPSWIGVVDIDHFKAVNDNYGHLFGDEVLLLVSRLMRDCFRGADQLYRFGGEEFVVVLDHANAAGAAVAFNRFRATVGGYAFPQVGKVTVSIGYTVLQTSDSPAGAIERADAALYYAKQNGRDQVQGYEDLVNAGRLARKLERAELELF